MQDYFVGKDDKIAASISRLVFPRKAESFQNSLGSSIATGLSMLKRGTEKHSSETSRRTRTGTANNDGKPKAAPKQVRFQADQNEGEIDLGPARRQAGRRYRKNATGNTSEAVMSSDCADEDISIHDDEEAFHGAYTSG